MRITENSDILLINVPVDGILISRELNVSMQSMPPLGLLYIATFIERNGYKVSFIDVAVEVFEMNELINIVRKINPKIIGMSTFVESWTMQKEFCSFLKKLFPECIIVAGGHCATFCYQRLLTEVKFDYAICGEGENSFLLLANFILRQEGDLNKISGLVYKDGLNIIQNKISEVRTDIDSLPFPDRNMLNLDCYSYAFTVSTARGCPGRCIFCSAHSFWGNQVRIRKAHKIVEEIEYVYNLTQLTDFFVIDDTFTFIPKRTLEFCSLLQELSKHLSKEFIWGCESRVDVATEELFYAMKQSGCRMVQFGMESGNDGVLESIKKGVKYEDTFKAVQLAHKVGFNINVSVILGHHSDTEKTMTETIQKAVELKREFGANVLFSINTPFPGTELYNNAEALGVEILSKLLNQYKFNMSVIRTKNLSPSIIGKYFAKATEAINFTKYVCRDAVQ